MIDWDDSKYAGKWYRSDKRQSMIFLIPFSAFTFFTLMQLYLFIRTNHIEYIILSVFTLIMLILLVIVHVQTLSQRKNMFFKTFNYRNDVVIKTIESVLKKNNIKYTKLGPRKTNMFKYGEIISINNGSMAIKVLKETGMGSKVGLGPVNKENEAKIENLKEEINTAFLPKELFKGQ